MLYLLIVYLVGLIVEVINNTYIIVAEIDHDPKYDEFVGIVTPRIIAKIAGLSLLWPAGLAFKVIMAKQIADDIDARRILAWDRYEAEQRRLSQKQSGKKQQNNEATENDDA